MSAETRFSFRNVEGDAIRAVFSSSEVLNQLEIISTENGVLNLKNTRYRFSRVPDHKEDTLMQLLFRDLQLLRDQESDLNNCSSFKLFVEVEEEECKKNPGEKKSVKVTFIKFGYQPGGQTWAKMSSVGFGILGGVGMVITGAGMVASSSLLAAGAATSALVGMAVTASQHAFVSEIDYDHQQCSDETRKAGLSGAFTGALTGFLGPVISNLPHVGQVANAVVSKVPVKATTVIKVIVAGGLGATNGAIDAIEEWRQGKSFKVSKIAIKSLSGMAGAVVSNGLLRGAKAVDAMNGYVRSSVDQIFDKTVCGGIDAGVRQVTENTLEGKPVGKLLPAVLLEGSTAGIGAAAKEMSRLSPEKAQLLQEQKELDRKYAALEKKDSELKNKYAAMMENLRSIPNAERTIYNNEAAIHNNETAVYNKEAAVWNKNADDYQIRRDQLRERQSILSAKHTQNLPGQANSQEEIYITPLLGAVLNDVNRIQYRIVKARVIQNLERQKRELEDKMLQLSNFIDEAPSKIRRARSVIMRNKLQDKVERAKKLHENYLNEWVKVCKNKELISSQNG